MPTMANVTVKLADGTTDYVLVALQPSGADGTAAYWRADISDAALPPAQRLTATLQSRWNDKRDARVTQVLIRRPILEDTAVAGVKRTVGQAECRDGRFVIPQNGWTSTAMDNFVAVATNFMASPLVKSSISSGFSPS